MARERNGARRPAKLHANIEERLNDGDAHGMGNAALLVGEATPFDLRNGPGGGTNAISLTAGSLTYTQAFDTLASSPLNGTSTLLPADWTFSETGGTAPTTYSVGTGSSTTADTWSYGVAGTNPVTERAFGSLASGTVTQILIGSSFANNSGGTITSLLISYFGEQWRRGGNTIADRLDFQISYDATSLTTGSWTDVNGLDFVSINSSGSALTLDGNSSANRLAISFNITGVGLANGGTFWIRWIDTNIGGNDDGLAIDNFSLTATITRPPVVAIPIPDHHSNEDAAVLYTVPANAFSDPDGNTPTYTAALADNSPLPSWLVFTAAMRRFSGTPPANFNGTLSVKVTASDGTFSVSDIFSLIIDPVNDAAIIGGTDTGAVTEDGGLTASGQLTISDVDPGESMLEPVEAFTEGDNGYGTFEMLADGSWTYTLYNDHPDVQALHGVDALTDMLTVYAADGTAHSLNVTIHGANEASADPYARVDEDALVNSSFAGFQSQPSVTFLADGRYVVVFRDLDDGQNDVRARIFNGDGSATAPDFRVNTTTAGEQHMPQVAALAGGGFVIVWQDDSAGLPDIRARIYEADGSAGDEIPIAAVGGTTSESMPSVASMPGGGFVVVWAELTDPFSSVRAQTFAADGSPIGFAFTVNESLGGFQGGPAVTVLAGGTIVAVWEDEGTGDVQARLFGPAGLPLTGERAANSSTSGYQGAPCVVALAGGGFAVAWLDEFGDADGYGIRARLFDAAGAPLGNDFQVNTGVAGFQLFPAIAALPDGGFVVSWTDNAGTNEDDIHAQRFDSSGVPIDAEFVVNSHTPGLQAQSALATNPLGALVAAWLDGGNPGLGGDTDGAVVHALFTPGGVAPPATAPGVDLDGGAAGIHHDGSLTEGSAAGIGVSIRVTQGSFPITSATITLTDGLAGDSLSVAGSLPLGITNISGNDQQIQLVGINMSAAMWAAALGQIAFTSSSDNPDDYGNETARTINVVVSDGVTTGTTAIATIAIQAVNDAPTVGALDGDSVTWTEGDPYVLLDQNAPAAVLDPDNQNFASGFVSFGVQINPRAEDEFFVLDIFPGVGTIGNDVYVDGAHIGTITSSGPGQILTISFNAEATVARVATLLDYIAYRNVAGDNPTAGDRSVTYLLNDGGGGVAAGVTTVSVVAINDAPGVLALGGDEAFWTEGGPYAYFDVGQDAVINDADSANFDGGSITIDLVTGVDGDDFVLIENSHVTLGAAVPGGTEVLVDGVLVGIYSGQGVFGGQSIVYLNGDATAAHVQEMLRAYAFRTFDTDPTVGTRDIDITVTDGDGGTTILHSTMTVVETNDPPSGFNSLIIMPEDTEYRFNLNDFRFRDEEGDGFGFLTIQDLPMSGQLLLNGTTVVVSGTMLSLNELAGGRLSFRPEHDASGIGYASFTFQVTDDRGAIDPTPNTMRIDVTPRNDAPRVADTNIAIDEDQVWVLSPDDFDIFDPEGDAIASIRITGVTGGTIYYDADGAGAGEPEAITLYPRTFSFGDLAAGLLSWVPEAGVNGSGASYFQYGVTDEHGALSAGARVYFDIAPVVDAPTVDLNGPGEADTYFEAAYFEGGPGAAIADSDVAITSDSGVLTGATITITDAAAGDLLSVAETLPGLITAFYDPDTATLTLSGQGTVAQYQAALTQILYSSTSEDPDAAGTDTQRTVEIVVTDGVVEGEPSSVPAYAYVAVTGAVDNPVIGNLDGDLATYTEGDHFVLLDMGGNVTVADLDNANFSGGGLTVSFNGTGLSQDRFDVIPTDSVSLTPGSIIVDGVTIGSWGGGFPGGDFTVSFNGNATPERLAALLGALGYRNSAGDAPVAGLREVLITLTDGAGGTVSTASQVQVVAVNDAPIVAANAGLALAEAATATITAAMLDYNDPEQADGAIIYTLGAVTNGSLRLVGSALGAGGSFTQADINGGLVAFVHDGSETTSASFAFSVSDGAGGSVSGQSFLVAVTPVNDAPVLTTTAGTTLYAESVNTAPGSIAVDTALTVTDADDITLFGAMVSISGNYQLGQDILAFTNDNAATFGNISAFYNVGTGVLTLTSAGATATLAQWQAALRAVTYSNSSEEPNQATRTISFMAFDGDAESAIATRLLSVTAQNDSPSGANGTRTINEDSTFTFTAAHFGFSDVDGDAFAGVRFGAAPVGGTLYFDADGAGGAAAVAVTSFPTTTFSAADIAAGRLTFVPTANLNGTGAASVSFSVVDNGGTTGAGQNTDTTPNTLSFDIVSVNDAPTGADKQIIIDEDMAYTLTVADFGYSDVDGNAFEAVIFSSNVTGGTLYINGNPMTNVTLVYLHTIQSGGVVFVPAANATGAVGSLTFTVRDDGGFDNGGQAADTSPNLLTFNMIRVNDAPVNTVPGTQAVDEDTPLVFSTANGNALSVADVDAVQLTVTLSVAHGTLTLASNVGVTYFDNPGDSMMTIYGTPAAINAALGAGLTYTPAVNYHGGDTLSITTSDSGQSGGGGTLIDADTVAITIDPVNDAPAGTSTAFTINEDSTFTFAESHFGFSDPVEGDDFLGVVIATIPSAGAILYDGVAVTAGQFITLHDIALGRLTFAPAPDANGAPYGSFTFQVRDEGGTGNGGQDTDQSPNTLTFNVTAVNDAPTNNVPVGQTIDEDSSLTLPTGNGNAISVADVDATTLTVTLSVAHGTLTIASALGLTFSAGSDGTADASMTFSGTAAAINAALGSGLTYNPNANFNGSDAISVVTTDGGQTGTGPVGTDSDSIAISIAAINDAPSGTSATIALDEDATRVLTQADFGFSDPAEGDNFAGVLLTSLPADGALLLNGVAVAVAGTFVTAAQLAASQLVFAPGPDGNGAGYASFDFAVRDDGGPANGGQDTDQTPNTLSFNVAAVNDAPAGADTTIVMNEDVGRVLTAADFGFGDTADGNAFAGVVLTSLPTAGFLIYDPDGAGFLPGVFANVGRFVTAAELALGALTYYPASHANGAGHASFTFRVRDNGGTADGGQDTDQSPNTITFDVNPVNDAPSGTDKSITGSEDDPYVFTAADFGFSDPVEGNAFLAVRITTLPNAGDILLNGVAVVEGDFIAVSAINAGMLTFQPDPDASGAPYASFTFEVQDDGGTAYGGQDTDQTPNRITITITPDNLAPVLDLDSGAGGVDAALVYTEGDPATLIAPAATLTDDSPDFAGGTITAGVTANGADEDQLSIRSGGGILVSSTDDIIFYGGIGIGSWGGGANGGDLVVQLNANAGAAAVEALLRAIAYANISENPSVLARTIAVAVTDGDGGASSAQVTVGLVAVDDAAVARNDAFTIDEAAVLSSNVFLDHGAGADGDVDGPGLTVSAVNGVGAHVGHKILLDSGALLTLNADGSFTYATNHAFDPTPTGSSGASNTPAVDHFTYTLAGGGTATVTLAITGLDTDDTLFGTAGADVLAGGLGNDSYRVENVADMIIESIGQGNDRVFASVSYTLTAGAEVETLTTDWHIGTDAIDLTGNALANIIFGNDGDNQLNGGDGADALVGRAGNDWFFVGNAGDQVVEAAGEGNDRLFASVSYTLGAGIEVEIMSTDWHIGTDAIHLTGNALANIIVGNDGDNRLNGGAGADTLVGRAGDDWFFVDDAGDQVVEVAGEGSDRLFASVSYTLTAGADVELMTTDYHAGTAAIDLTGNALLNTIYGNAGANVLDGKGGNDGLLGFGGADMFQFTTALGAGNVDTIFDFVAGTDKIALDDAIFTAIGGTLDADAFVIGSAAADADDRIVYNQATGELSYDADGSGGGAAIQFATLSPGLSLTATDFQVI